MTRWVGILCMVLWTSAAGAQSPTFTVTPIPTPTGLGMCQLFAANGAGTCQNLSSNSCPPTPTPPAFTSCGINPSPEFVSVIRSNCQDVFSTYGTSAVNMVGVGQWNTGTWSGGAIGSAYVQFGIDPNFPNVSDNQLSLVGEYFPFTLPCDASCFTTTAPATSIFTPQGICTNLPCGGGPVVVRLLDLSGINTGGETSIRFQLTGDGTVSGINQVDLLQGSLILCGGTPPPTPTATPTASPTRTGTLPTFTPTPTSTVMPTATITSTPHFICATPLHCKTFTPTPTATSLGNCSNIAIENIIANNPTSFWSFRQLPPFTPTLGTATPGTPTPTWTPLPAADLADSNSGTYSSSCVVTDAGVDLDGSDMITTAVTYPAEQQQTVLVCFYGTTGTLGAFGPSPIQNQSPTALLEVSDAGTVWWGITYGAGQQQIVPPSLPSWEPPTVSDGRPHVVIATFGPTGGQIVYLDGKKLEGSRPYTVFISKHPSTWTWGWGNVVQWPAVSTFGYQGHLDGAAWWKDRQLTDGEVNLIFFTPTSTPTVTTTPTMTPTQTPIITRPTRTSTPTFTVTPTGTATGTPPTATASQTATVTSTPSFAPTITPIPLVCLPGESLVTIGPFIPISCSNAAASPPETSTWANPNNAMQVDGIFAQVGVTDAAQSVAIKCVFRPISQIPPPTSVDRIIDITLHVRNINASGLWFEGTNPMAGIHLTRSDGSLAGSDLSRGARLPDANVSDWVYDGGTWGTSWAAADVNGSDFGSLFAVDGPSGLSTNGNIDAFEMAISWCHPNPTPTPTP